MALGKSRGLISKLRKRLPQGVSGTWPRLRGYTYVSVGFFMRTLESVSFQVESSFCVSVKVMYAA